ncbi:MAG: DUF2065 domain-containing protein [Methylococcales bacterium]
MWQDFLAAVALMLVLEGIMPFLSPRRLRGTLHAFAQFDNRTIRILGLVSMAAGTVLLYIVR